LEFWLAECEGDVTIPDHVLKKTRNNIILNKIPIVLKKNKTVLVWISPEVKTRLK